MSSTSGREQWPNGLKLTTMIWCRPNTIYGYKSCIGKCLQEEYLNLCHIWSRGSYNALLTDIELNLLMRSIFIYCWYIYHFADVLIKLLRNSEVVIFILLLCNTMDNSKIVKKKLNNWINKSNCGKFDLSLLCRCAFCLIWFWYKGIFEVKWCGWWWYRCPVSQLRRHQ